MEDAAFSDEFCRFLRTVVPTVEAAELLLVLQREPGRWWSAAEAASVIESSASLTEADAAHHFSAFQANRLAAVGPDKRAQYRPADAGVDAHARTLEQAYRERPVTLIRMIYALRDSNIRSFADAFRLRNR